MRSNGRVRRAATLLLTAAWCVALFSPAVGVSAQSFVVVDSVRLPAESYVGDSIELRYRIRTQATLEAPSQPPQPGWGTIETVRLSASDGEYDVRMLVTPYEPGTLTLPRIDLGDIALEGLSISVASVLGGTSEVRSIYGPQRLPGTRIAILLAVLGIAIPVSLAFYLTGPGRAVLGLLVARYRARVPYRNLLRTIDRLEASIKHDTAREFYTRLVYSIQDLMTSRLGFECRAATSSELRAYLPAFAARCGADPQRAEPLVEVFVAADDAKFAHGHVRRKTRLEHLERCRSVFTKMETSRRRQRAMTSGEARRVGV